MKSILEKVEATVLRHGMLQESGCTVLAVSGGPDSLALLHLVWELCRGRYPSLSLHVGHLHHGMRGRAADEDAAFVSASATALGLPCTVGRADVPRLAQEHGTGLEVAGREARYEFLTRLAQSLGATRIALGHQADDQAETVLMRCIRGAGPRGIGGIPYVRPVAAAPGVSIVRPLLDCSRREIEQFLRRRGLNSRLDSTNLSPDYLRNRVRASILPRMKKEWGEGLRVDLCSLATSAQRLQRQADALSSALSSAHAVKVEAGRVEAEQAWLRRLPPAILPDLLQRWLKQGGLWSRTLTARQYDEVAALLRHGRGAVALPGSALACLHRGRFIIRRNLRRRAPGFAAQLAAPGVTPIDPARGYLEAKVLEGGKELVENRRLTRDRFEEFLDLEKLHLPLGVRFLRPGDRMKPLGAPGTRKLQDILTDLHVPAWQRPDTLVVTMNDKPIWIVGVRIADAVKLTHTTRKVLRLRFVRTK